MDSALAPQIDLSKLSEPDKRELQQFVVNEAQKAKLQNAVHTLTNLCFQKCIAANARPGVISAGKLDSREEGCMASCVDRFMDANGLVLGKLEEMRR
ncbi:MAG: Mitochondrial import inner membrane translocase subunit tim8 [Caeruleum heppii]|nr:MAG: Mitochondrial import inner membrane translocase subunit tim8 [Caeruleum heppii]